MALDPVGHDSADERKKKNGNAAEKLIERQQECRVAQAINEPALCNDLHPGPDAGDARPNPHQAEIAIVKGFEDPADGRGFEGCDCGGHEKGINSRVARTTQDYESRRNENGGPQNAIVSSIA